MKYFLLITSLLILPFTLFASQDDLTKSKGTTQDVIVQLMPSPAQEDVSRYTKIEASFNVPLDAKHVKKFDVKLKCLSCKKKNNIQGTVNYSEAEKKVTFTPAESLTPGVYEVEFKSLKADKSYKNTKIKEIKYRFVVVLDATAPVITLNGEKVVTVFKGNSYEELGATAIDDRDGDVNVTVSGTVDTNTLGSYMLTYSATDEAGNQASITRTVNVVAPVLTSIGLESNATTLNIGEKAELTVIGTYSDNSTKELDTNVEWIVAPVDSLDVNGSMLTAKKESKVTVQAKVGTLLSNTLNLNIVWIVNGHVLPPEPDPTDNNSTLLGIDSNANGVRDDVERWIYEKYKDKHPIHIDIAMQAGRAWQTVLEDPSRAKEIHDYVSAPIYCEGYYKLYASEFNDPILVTEEITTEYFRQKIIFNTKDRLDAYNEYNFLLSGDSYTIPWPDEAKKYCDFDTNKYKD